MRTIARFMDARNTAEGKFLSVMLSVLLVFSFLNVTMFTDFAGAETTGETNEFVEGDDANTPDGTDEGATNTENTGGEETPDGEEGDDVVDPDGPEDETTENNTPVVQNEEFDEAVSDTVDVQPRAKERKKNDPSNQAESEAKNYVGTDYGQFVRDQPEGKIEGYTADELYSILKKSNCEFIPGVIEFENGSYITDELGISPKKCLHKFYVTNGDIKVNVENEHSAKITLEGNPGDTTVLVHEMHDNSGHVIGYQIFTVTWKEAGDKPQPAIEYTIEYYYDDVFDNNLTVTKEAVSGSVIESYQDQLKTGYAFDRVENIPLTVTDNTENNVIRVYYAKDEIGTDPENPDKGDGVPDKYQATVAYVVENGSWDEGTHPASQVVTFTKDGKNVEPGTEGATHTALAVPSATAEAGYDNGVWSPSENGALSKDGLPATVTGDATFTLAYSKGQVKFTIEYYYDDAEKPGKAPEGAKTEATGLLGANVNLYGILKAGFAEVDVDGVHYVLVSEPNGALAPAVTISADPSKNVIKVYYAKDEIGTDPENPDKGDGVPDKYQATVAYTAFNGTVSLSKAVVTLFAPNGKTWAEDGVGHLAENQVASATADSGYNQGSLYWTGTVGTDLYKEAPSTEIDITGDSSFFAFFDPTAFSITVKVVNGTASDYNGELVLGADGSYATKVNINGSESFSFQPDEGYALDSVEIDGKPGKLTDDGEYSFAGVTEDHSIVVVYAKDEIGTDPENPDKGDGVPDKYQATVTYASSNTLHGTVAGEVKKVFTLMKDDEFVEEAVIIPTSKGVKVDANSGWVFDGWNNDPALPVAVKGGEIVRYTAYWAADTIGPNPGQGDGTADKYQAVINFRVNNGSWNNGATAPIRTVVTLRDANGQLSENGTATLTAPAVGNRPAQGYQRGAWQNRVPVSVNASFDGYTFTYNYAAQDAPAPTPGPTPNPQPPAPQPTPTPTVVTPAPTPAAAPAPAPAATPAPAAPAAEAIADDPTPQAATPRAEAKAQQIEDEATPMGAFDEPHCWIHWVMLIGILLTAVYGIVVVRRRLGLADKIDDMEKQVIGVEDAETETVAVAGHQAL